MIDSYLKLCEFKQSSADPCIYFKITVVNKREIIIIIAIYVDDTILCSNDITVLISMKKQLSTRFEMDDRGEVHFILGMKISRNREKGILSIDQRAYLEAVLRKFGMQDCKPTYTPVDSGAKFTSLCDQDEESVDVRLYQAAIGSLNYAAVATRPDLSVAVGILSQFMQSPTQAHWVGIKRVFRYIRGTLNYGLVYRSSESCKLYGYSDSDWAGCVESRKSTSGHIFLLGNCTVSWRSKKQSVVALSSTEAEYVALCAASQEAVWMRRLLKDVGQGQSEATVIYEDNQGALALSHNPKHHPRTKHIDVKFHYIRETVEKKLVSVQYIPTADMTADTLTKGLAKPKFEKFREAMGVSDVLNALQMDSHQEGVLRK